jgi:hypothetical protein
MGNFRDGGPLHATIEEFAAEGYTHVECFCPRCRIIRLRPMSWLRKSRWASISRNYRRGFGAPNAEDRFIHEAVASSGHAREAGRATGMN